MNPQYFLKFAAFALSVIVWPTMGFPQQDKLQQAIGIQPKQQDVEFDTPSADELKNCKIELNKDPAGFIVTDNAGRVLRLFTDNNDDKKLDQWSFFKNGIEVYRDIDSNYDAKSDQYRWLGSEGTRWGLDPDQDGTIDEWKIISAEEVVFESFQAIKNRDLPRFRRLLITPDEFKALELGTPIATEIQKRWKAAQQDFEKFCATQKQIGKATKWVHSSNGLPAMVPAGSSGNQQDIVVYDHASAVFESDDYGQLAVGTVVQIDKGVWRLFELPEVAEEGKPITNGGAFFPFPDVGNGADGPNVVSVDPQDEKLAEMYTKLESLEKELANTDQDAEIARLEEDKAKMLEQFYNLTKPGEQKLNWLKNIADSVASAYQRERFPDGLKFLDEFLTRLQSAGQKDGLDYIRWRTIYARFGKTTETGDGQAREEAQEKLIADLTEFQRQFKDSPISAEALNSLGIHFEISGESKDAEKWYRETTNRFPETDFGKRAAGALVRLEGKGKPVSFVGQDLRGNQFNLQDPQLRDKIVVIHFWETWCTDGLDEIQRLAEKYKEDVVFVGCNIELESDDFKAYMQKNPDHFTWTQLHAPGSMEKSPLAQQLGVPSEPLVLMIDKKGNLAEPDVAFSDLEREIQRQRRK